MSLGKSTVKVLVIGLVIGLVAATIPSFLLIQDREDTIFSLTQRNIVQADNIVVLLDENSGLLTDKKGLETQLESTRDDLSASKEETVLVLQEKAQVVSEKEAVERALSELRRVEEDLRSDLLQVQRELRQAQIELSQLRVSQFDIEDKWNLWKRHSALAPQERSQYAFLLFFPRSGDFTIPAPSILVSFPNPANCLLNLRITTGGGMKPAINVGHTVIANSCFNSSEIRPGDMIAYQRDTRHIISQVIEVRSDGVLTKGINQEEIDPEVKSWAIITGIVVAIIY